MGRVLRAFTGFLGASLQVQVGWALNTELVGDTTGLVQVATRVHEDNNPGQPQPAFQPQQVLGKLQELQHKWSEHVEKRITEIEQEKAQVQKAKEDAVKAKEEAEENERKVALAREIVAKAAAEAAASKAAEEEEEKANDDEHVKELQAAAERYREEQAKEKAANEMIELRRQEELKEAAARHSKFGEELSVTVKTIRGSFNTTLYENTRVQVLLHSATSKLGMLNTTEPVLVLNGKELNPMSFASEAGIKNGDVVELKSELLLAAYKAQAEEASRVELAQREEQEQRKAQEEMKARKKNKLEADAKEAKRQARLKREDMVELKFIHESGGMNKGEYSVAVKSNNWLQPTVDLLAKRLGLDPAKVRLRRKDGTAIAPHDSVRTLNLKPMTELVLHSPYKVEP